MWFREAAAVQEHMVERKAGSDGSSNERLAQQALVTVATQTSPCMDDASDISLHLSDRFLAAIDYFLGVSIVRCSADGPPLVLD